METPSHASLPVLDHATCSAEALTITELLGLLGGKWTIQIFGRLSSGPARFTDLRKSVEGISQKVLTTTLRDLERDGMITRTVTPVIPPRVDYELTPLGREVLQPVHALGQWARANRGRVEEARRAFSHRLAIERDADWSQARRPAPERAGTSG